MSKMSFTNRRLKEKMNNSDFLVRCDCLRREFHAGSLIVKPQWWTDLREIELKKDKEYLRPEGLILIENISVDKLIEKIRSENSGILKQGKLFHDKLDMTKTCKIIEHWKNGEKLIPPTIVWSSYYETIEIENGRHRLNVAICFQEKYVPIMTSFLERDKIVQLLN